MELIRQAERSISKTYRKTIWKPFIGAIQRFNLIKEGDSIAVCLSGGKDSLLLACTLRMLLRYSDFPFSLSFIFMNPGYNDEYLTACEYNMKKLGISPHMFNTDILRIAENNPSPCHICSSMRRGYLYKEAQRLGCNKIALGHHLDDVCETVLLSILYSGEFRTMMPRLNSINYAGMQLIRPLYLVRERSIINWLNNLNIGSISCSCSFTKKDGSGKRREIKKLLTNLEKQNPNIINNILSSTQNVNLQTVLSYKKDADFSAESYLDFI
jgi:tRNA(Ile)-lysidine synthase TilS/MesJ